MLDTVPRSAPRVSHTTVKCQAVADASSPEAVLDTTGVAQLYRYPGLSGSKTVTLLHKAQGVVPSLTSIDSEVCFNIALSEPLTEDEAKTLTWLLRETYEPDQLAATPSCPTPADAVVVEVGPRMNFSTAWSSNAVSICSSVGLSKVTRIERSTRFTLSASSPLEQPHITAFAALVHDKMTEQVYEAPLESFEVCVKPAAVKEVRLLEEGRPALEAIDAELGLAFDAWDMDYYTDMFVEQLGRNPTNVELFDMAQSNSEHCRHWFFGGDMVIDGVKKDKTLFRMVKDTLTAASHNSVIGFKDNSSAIRGGPVTPLLPAAPGTASPLAPASRDWDLLLTAETHNFPCAVAPYPGAETGAGGRIRDTHATGSGSIMGVATAGYCVGNLQLEGYTLPWEDASFQYPDTLASPQQILIEASNGASDYGNKFGEPVIAGYTRTYGQRLPDGERREWIKPIMFSAGIGQIDHRHLEKGAPDKGMLVVKIGGPAYRIGMGGGAASSAPSGSRGNADLDFDAVQRGDAEMSQKLWRVVRTCVEMGADNPIVQIHDQGAGGNCNVVKEIIYPLGAEVDIRAVKLGDDTMSVLEIWGAEYQENDCVLIKPGSRALLQAVCDRERCFMQVIATLNGSGRITLVDSQAQPGEPSPAVDLDLKTVLGELPSKTFTFSSVDRSGLTPVTLPEDTTCAAALDRVLRLPAVASKRFLTTKVDRCVTGLVAQQQCVGPLQLPLADVAVAAQSHQDTVGIATSIGEAPIKGLVSPAAMARLALTEALTNLVWARVSALRDVKASVNWMYAAKLGSEGADMYEVAEALTAAMTATGVACDGGKDSLSMVSNAGDEMVKAPGSLVISTYVACPDVTATVTPDLKLGDDGVLLHVDLAEGGGRRLGGASLAQVYEQLGSDCPDVDMAVVAAAFNTTQGLIEAGTISAGHDISDGGLAVCLLEMAFGGNSGLTVDLPAHPAGPAAVLFAEEAGLVLEVIRGREGDVLAAFAAAGVPAAVIGSGAASGACELRVGGAAEVEGHVAALRATWEATAFALERLQCTEDCVAAEEAAQVDRASPSYSLSYIPTLTSSAAVASSDRPRVAVVREEGSNGDREMAAALHAAGLQPWDVHMSDLLAGTVTLADFRGVVFVGGFSYADVLDSAKGWASAIKFNPGLLEQFRAFYDRPDTFSLGVCNGCQLMALLGWVGAGPGETAALPDEAQPRLVHNSSGRFECRWTQVAIQPSPAIMLEGMEGSRLGVWAAHGEGKFHFPVDSIKEAALSGGLAPIRYTTPTGGPTEEYPFNPNGSPEGVAALCSADGRHLAMMPHPERCFLAWQQPYAPASLGLSPDGAGPWLKLFQNARAWVDKVDAGEQ